ncbi:MAG TPA: MBL fold metallo-hydrolase [Anaerolineales bacterium]|nr:MBL fold metallo-hydrolase [Anaerolineales bacterium]
MNEKPSFATVETSSGAKIHRIPLEAFPNFWAYVYVVLKDDFCVLIDSGSGIDSSHQDLLSGLEQAGLQPSDLTYILLTHAHIDHYGGLFKLKPLVQAKIGCHELDVQTIAHHEARLALVSRRLTSFLVAAGLAEETRDQLLSIYRFTKALYQSVPVDFTYEAMDMHLGPFELIHLPGHCPGHVAIHLDDVIFCGDMVVEGVTPHLAPESIAPYGGLDHYLESLARFQAWAKDARLIFNGHDDVITDLPAEIGATHQNLVRRMSKALEALSEPRTTSEICAAVYGETGGYNQLLVIEKTGAYIEYFYEHGMIEMTNVDEVEQGLPARYRRLRKFADEEILPKQKHSVVE